MTKGVSTVGNIVINPNTSQTFYIDLPLSFCNVNFARGLVGDESLKIKFKFAGA